MTRRAQKRAREPVLPTPLAGQPEFLIARAAQHVTAPILLLAHGAGAPMDSPFLETMTESLRSRGITVARFEFAYMATRRQGSGRRPPPKMDILAAEYRAAAAAIKTRFPNVPLFIGGKSMGGRVASLIAGDLFEQGVIAGCVCLGYPFHPAKRPESLRTAHLAELVCPALVVQGERDPLGSRGEVEGMSLSTTIGFAWIGDGDHDLRPRAASGLTHQKNLECAADAVVRYIKLAART